MSPMAAAHRPPGGHHDEPAGTQLPLARGQRGRAVADLQQRLSRLGYSCDGNVFDHETERAVRAFQRDRGLREDGAVDRSAWSAIVEAGYHLGDRPLYRSRPMLRGDDVADLQRRLSQLGFDPGRIDGILGDETVAALMDFQRNAGLVVDGVCGHRTIGDLERLTTRKGGADLVSPLRERLLLAGGERRTLAARRVAVSGSGGFAAGIASVCRALEREGATALALQHPDASQRAAEANAAEAHCLIDLELTAERDDCTTSYYRGYRYESVASRHLAEIIQAELPSVLRLRDGGTSGMALAILRETRMPAVELRLGTPVEVVRRTPDLARVLVDALDTWLGASWE